MSIITPSGFPALLGGHGPVMSLAIQVGNQLATLQPSIVAVHEGRQAPDAGSWIKKKDDGSSVTAADIYADVLLRDGLSKLAYDRNTIGLITEEGDTTQNLREALKPACFVIDPLDNTGSYKRGAKDWSVTVGFLHAGMPTGGIVYYPALRQLFWTAEDGCAYISNSFDVTVPASDQSRNGKNSLTVITDDGVSSSFSSVAAKQIHAGHTQRYWAVLMSGKTGKRLGLAAGADWAEHGGLFYAWDVVAPAAIAARAGVTYLRRNGLPLTYLHSDNGLNPFELPKEGFIAGNNKALRALGLG